MSPFTPPISLMRGTQFIPGLSSMHPVFGASGNDEGLMSKLRVLPQDLRLFAQVGVRGREEAIMQYQGPSTLRDGKAAHALDIPLRPPVNLPQVTERLEAGSLGGPAAAAAGELAAGGAEEGDPAADLGLADVDVLADDPLALGVDAAQIPEVFVVVLELRIEGEDLSLGCQVVVSLRVLAVVRNQSMGGLALHGHVAVDALYGPCLALLVESGLLLGDLAGFRLVVQRVLRAPVFVASNGAASVHDALTAEVAVITGHITDERAINGVDMTGDDLGGGNEAERHLDGLQTKDDFRR
ncbi:hypothetical protein PG984_002976 [Apiospora sp. TS-2023a]